ncbi:MAG: methionine synthase [Clostridia bacterium]|nr:methionine synthase [Clostridia bacterium]MBQ8469169.1 methionine synthase [Clostridia bacterium]MBR1704046.1 methionine synthase [Clostridia bacterium]
MMTLGPLDHREAVRYLGDSRVAMTEEMEALLTECEEEVLAAADPKFLYKVKELPCPELMVGKDIAEHLDGCSKVVLLCATVGAGIDRMLRIAQVKDMSRAVVLDSMSSVAIEQVCRKFDEFIAEEYPDLYQTFRFSPGYGDYPIDLQKWFLTELDAPKKIGLTTNDSYLLIPTKSVTAVMGLSETEPPKRKRGCASCNLRETCNFRKRGAHCGA